MDVKGWSIDMVAQSFSDQVEYTNLYSGMTNAQIVSQVYNNVLNRDADAAGAAYWEGELNSGIIQVNQLIQAVVNAAKEDVGNLGDDDVLANKNAVSQQYYDLALNFTNISLSQITADAQTKNTAIIAAQDSLDPSGFTFTDTGISATDGITSNGTISVALADDTTSWQYSTDGGETWVNGSGTSFRLADGTYNKQNIQVKQFAAAGNFSVSLMGTANSSMVQLEALGVTNYTDSSPQITALSDGSFVVTFRGQDSDGDDSIFIQKFNADGTKVGSMVQLEAIGNTGGTDAKPQITALSDGSFAIVFIGYTPSATPNGIFIQKFNADGTTIGSMVQLTESNGIQSNPQIISFLDGSFAVTFEGRGDDYDHPVFVQKFNADGTAAGVIMELFQFPYSATPQITTFLDDAFAIAFSGTTNVYGEGGWSVFVQKFNVDGTAVSSIVGFESNSIASSPQITTLSDGSFAVTFQGYDSNGDFSVFVQKFNADGTTTGSMVQLEAIGQTNGHDQYPQITALLDGSFVVAFQGSDSNLDFSVFVQKFNADGTTTGNAMVQLEGIGVTNGGDINPQITALSDGSFAVIFQGNNADTGNHVFIQKFNADGTTMGSIVQLEPAGRWMYPQITALANGEFAVIFQGVDEDYGDDSIFVQKFNADGTLAAHPLNTIVVDSTIQDSTNLLASPESVENNLITGTDGEDVFYVLTSGTNSITGGAGSDMIWLGDENLGVSNGGADTIVIANTDSLVGTPDQIVYFELDKDKLDLPSATIATTSTDVSNVTAGGVTVGKVTITNGIATFQAADNTTSVAITSIDALSAALDYLNGAIADGDTVAFEYNLFNVDATGTYIFQGGASGDIAVDLIGVSVTATDLSEILV